MIKCVNSECENAKYELEDNIEICPLCGKPTEKIETSLDYRRPLGAVISIISIAAVFLALAIPFAIIFYLGIFVVLACIVTSIIIRMKAAIIVSVLSIASVIGVLIYYGVL